MKAWLLVLLLGCTPDIPLLDERYDWSCWCTEGPEWQTCATEEESYEEATAEEDKREKELNNTTNVECFCRQRLVCGVL